MEPAAGEVPPCHRPVYIEVAGDVPFPGVYSFCTRPPLRDALLVAGFSSSGGNLGVQEDARLSSGARVSVLKTEGGSRVFAGDMSAFYKLTLGAPISLNRESEEGLTALPGIGPMLAKAICTERARRGGFRDMDELRSVRGIGEKVYERIRPHMVL